MNLLQFILSYLIKNIYIWERSIVEIDEMEKKIKDIFIDK